MSSKFLLLIIFSVTLSAIAQISLKSGMSSPAIQEALVLKERLNLAWLVLTNAHVIAGTVLYMIGFGLWLLVLAKLDVSIAYPFVGIGFILTMIFGFLFLNEPVGLTRVLGTILVAGGVVLVSSS